MLSETLTLWLLRVGGVTPQYCGSSTLLDYINSTAYSDWPIRAPTCAFVQGGAGVPGPVLSLLVFGPLGLAMAWRIQHPGPIVVSGILVAGVVAISAPGGAINILALVLFIGIAIVGLYLYQQAQSSL